MRCCFFALLLMPALAVAEPKSRTFYFTYEATVSGLNADQQARIWIPAPQSNDDQEVLNAELTTPNKPTTSIEPSSGNRMHYVAAQPDADGNITLKAIYTIRRKAVIGSTDLGVKEVERFLKPDPLAPENGKHLKLIEGKQLPDDPMDKAREFYQIVNGMMRYAKEGTEWGRGDVNWVCDSKFGNCTDFHSLFIALARSQKIPAKFEIGFSIPTERGSGDIAGYHCWAKFNPAGKGWIPVDISEANKNRKLADYCFCNLTEDRVTFTTGRGLTLSPKQDGPPLNFFVYPYVEVEGKPYAKENVKSKFAYEDVMR